MRIPHRQKLILDNVSWDEYTRFLRSFEGHHLRLTYDRGRLEIMTLSHQHEGLGWFLDKMVFVLTEELNLPIKGGGSTTFRKKKKHKGLEADNCYWIAHEADVRGKTVIKLSIDPPPDLAIEVDISPQLDESHANLRSHQGAGSLAPRPQWFGVLGPESPWQIRFRRRFAGFSFADHASGFNAIYRHARSNGRKCGHSAIPRLDPRETHVRA